MKIIHILSGVLVVACFVFGTMAAGGPPIGVDQTVIQAGAIILAGLLISLAISENRRD